MKYQTIIIALFFASKLVGQVPSFQEKSSELGIDEVATITDLYGHGAAAADFDNDGDIDFYLTTDQDIPDRLYRNDGKGHFEDIAQEVGIIETKPNRTTLWFDYNGDQLLDLVVAGENCVNLSCENPVHLAFYQQQQDGTFTEISKDVGLTIGTEFDDVPFYAIGGLAAADFNQDQYLDLVFSVWGGGIKLFRNHQGKTFSDITEESGLVLEEPTPWQPMLHDFNGDGLIDIYCNIDFAPNKLWINLGDTFEDQAAEYGLDNAFNEMGMAMSDYDNDGDLDIYITNITRYYQGEFQYNLFYKQEKVNGQIKFREIAESLGVSQSGWDWGTTFADINNDGRADLLTTNGWSELLWGPDLSKLWLNTKAGFVDVSEQCGFNDFLSANTLIGFDIERDGDVDILQTLKRNDRTKKPVLIHENKLEELPYSNNYINVKPRMQGPNHWAIGSVVTVVGKELISSRLISAGCSFYGQEPAEAFFGLGTHEKVKEVIVKWPTNEISIYQDLKINQINTLYYDFIKPPKNLSSTFENGQVKLMWRDESDNEIGFVLHKAEDSTFAEYETISLEKNQTSYTDFTIKEATTYYYKLRAFNAYVLSDNSNTTAIQTGETVQTLDTGIVVYPNPITQNQLTIRSQIPYEGMVHMRLLDISGKLLQTQSYPKSSPIHEFNHSLELPNGIYFLHIKMGDLEEWHKLLVKTL